MCSYSFEINIFEVKQLWLNCNIINGKFISSHILSGFFPKSRDLLEIIMAPAYNKCHIYTLSYLNKFKRTLVYQLIHNYVKQDKEIMYK